MSENRLFLNKKMKCINNIIFLDIDGVLQPYNYNNRFNHNLDKLQTYLSKKFKAH